VALLIPLLPIQNGLKTGKMEYIVIKLHKSNQKSTTSVSRQGETLVQAMESGLKRITWR
jgi:hypothetical protein